MEYDVDVGPEMINTAFETNMIDDEWSIRSEREFTWWGYEQAQRVWADPPIRTEGVTVTKVHARTDVLRDVPDTEKTFHLVSLLNMTATLSPLIFDPDTGKVYYHSTAYLHEQNFWLVSQIFMLSGSMQAADARVKTLTGLADLFDGEVDATSHPQSGERPEPDDMLNLLEDVVAPAGAEPSPFTSDNFAMLEDLDPNPSVQTNAGENGVTAEFPFSGGDPVVKSSDAGQPPQTALFQAFNNQPHPQIGNGCLVLLHVPLSTEDRVVANELNRQEAETGGGNHLLGAWCMGPRGLAFTTFYPAMIHHPALLAGLLMGYSIRSMWSHQTAKQLGVT